MAGSHAIIVYDSVLPDCIERVTLVDKLQDGYRTKSIINDLGKKGITNTFSEASRRTIKELGNIELHELGEISKTVQCPWNLSDVFASSD